MSGLGPVLYVPWGASATWLLAFAKAEDGSAIDLTGATDVSFTLKTSPTITTATLSLSVEDGGLEVIDAPAGLVRVSLTATQCAALRSYGFYTYTSRAALADGSVVIPDLLRGLFTTSLASAEEQSCEGGSITRLDAATGTLTPLTPDMSNYVINRYDLTGLTGGASTALDGLSAETLGRLAANTTLRLVFPGSIVAEYRLRANAGSETEFAPWRILCDEDADRLWELVSVHKEGVPCSWDPDLEKFRQVLIATGALALADAADAFELPA